MQINFDRKLGKMLRWWKGSEKEVKRARTETELGGNREQREMAKKGEKICIAETYDTNKQVNNVNE